MIVNGTALEMGALQVQFKDIYDFLERDWQNPEKVYQSFSLYYYWPFFNIIPEQLLPVVYVVDFVTKYYLSNIRFNFAKKLRQTNIPFTDQKIFTSTPYISYYFKMRGTPQALIFWSVVVLLLLISISITFKITRLICSYICGNKKAAKVEQKKNVNSAQRREKIE